VRPRVYDDLDTTRAEVPTGGVHVESRRPQTRFRANGLTNRVRLDVLEP